MSGGSCVEMKPQITNKYLICAYRQWSLDLFENKFAKLENFCIISNRDHLTLGKIKEINPDIIFFLDWSWIIEPEIIDSFFCVGFHSAPLPEFRGGSPIQNQIIRGINNTKLTAFRMDRGIDTGNILLQKDLNLTGHLKDIFDRIASSMYDMIIDITKGEYAERKQEGKGSYFKRREPKESELTEESFKDEQYLYNFIRMLEDPYPNAFMDIGNFRLLFKSAEKQNDGIFCSLLIKRRE